MDPMIPPLSLLPAARRSSRRPRRFKDFAPALMELAATVVGSGLAMGLVYGAFHYFHLA